MTYKWFALSRRFGKVATSGGSFGDGHADRCGGPAFGPAHSRYGPGVLIGFASTEGGCAHYRAELPATLLAAAGFDTVWTVDLVVGSRGGFAFPRDDGSKVEPDVVVLAGGWPACDARLITATRQNGQRVIVDCDDWPQLPTDNPHYAGAQMGAAKARTMLAADAVTCSTRYLQDHLARRWKVSASVCRNVIDVTRYADVHAGNRARSNVPRRSVTVGYRGMLCGFHDDDVRELRQRLPASVKYVHAGADVRGDTFANITRLPAELVTDRAAVLFDRLPMLLAGVDLAVIPFAARPFSQAKSAIAALEWTAAGVPWVATAQPEYARLYRPAVHSPARLAALVERYADAPAVRAELLERQTAAARLARLENAHDVARAWSQVVDRVVGRPRCFT